jgi:NCAIR mutase (PurE)-related protein
MDKQIEELLKQIKNEKISVPEGVERLTDCFFSDLGFAKVDHHRIKRCGFPEVIYCKSKTPGQVALIAVEIFNSSGSLLATKANTEHFNAVKKVLPKAKFNSDCGIITITDKPVEQKGLVTVITAGTSDIPVAEEASLTAEISESKVDRIYDVGVAGIHRLLSFRDKISEANVIVCVAGMEGALPSILAGLVAVPVIAVPTSVGYGASFKGIAPLLTMLNTCASGVTVVNIDNGYGAGYAASMINKAIAKQPSGRQ